MLDEAIGLEGYLHGPMDAGTRLKVNFRTEHLGLRERGKRFREVDQDDDMFTCDCGSAWEDRIYMVGEGPFHESERERNLYK